MWYSTGTKVTLIRDILLNMNESNAEQTKVRVILYLIYISYPSGPYNVATKQGRI